MRSCTLPLTLAQNPAVNLTADLDPDPITLASTPPRAQLNFTTLTLTFTLTIYMLWS